MNKYILKNRMVFFHQNEKYDFNNIYRGYNRIQHYVYEDIIVNYTNTCVDLHYDNHWRIYSISFDTFYIEITCYDIYFKIMTDKNHCTNISTLSIDYYQKNNKILSAIISALL